MQYRIQPSNEVYRSVSGLNFYFDFQEVCITICGKRLQENH